MAEDFIYSIQQVILRFYFFSKNLFFNYYFLVCNFVVSGFRGVIESPNFPNNYPDTVNCNWEIQVPIKNKINISFSHFDLETVSPNNIQNKSLDSKCLYDFVEVIF